jgi:pimeloyl-ACP methyl ester carboxylesterase
MAITGANVQRDRTVSFWGLRLFVRESGDGYPLLLINGVGASVEMWGPSQERLAAVARTISFDAPGIGRSRTSPVVLIHPASAKIICRLLDHLGVERCDVLGFSLGGAIAQQLARTAPDRVRRVALVGTSCGWGGVMSHGRALIANSLRFYSGFAFDHGIHLLDAVARDRDSDTLRAQADARLGYPPTLTGLSQQCLAGATWSSLHWISTLRAPTLVIAGEHDRLVPPANALLLARHVPDARCHVLAGEGHLMLLDPDSSVHSLLADFFSSPTLDSCAAWTDGSVVDDHSLRGALRDAAGLQPFRTLNSIYRRWVALPPVHRLADRLGLIRGDSSVGYRD